MNYKYRRQVRSRCSLVLAVCVITTSGCATDSQRTRTEPTVLGAFLGALMGYAASGGDPRGAAYGAAGGGVVGYGAGEYRARQKDKYAAREQELTDSAQQAHQLAADARQQNAQLIAQINQLDQTVQTLRATQLTEQQRLAWLQRNGNQAANLGAQVDGRLRQGKF